MDPIELSSLLCSRLCHDLANPVGALRNGAELLAEEHDPDVQADCIRLLDDSARQTGAVLTFFRLAFGGGAGYGASVNLQEARDALAGRFPPAKVSLSLSGAEQQPKVVVKLLMNLALLCGEALVRGGRLEIDATAQGNARTLTLRAEGPRIIVPDEIRAALIQPLGSVEATARLAPALLARLLADQNGGVIALPDGPEGTFAITATLTAA